jgi:hypothetical protein
VCDLEVVGVSSIFRAIRKPAALVRKDVADFGFEV